MVGLNLVTGVPYELLKPWGMTWCPLESISDITFLVLQPVFASPRFYTLSKLGTCISANRPLNQLDHQSEQSDGPLPQ